MEQDQHSGPEQGTGRAPDPGAGRADEQPEAREAAAAGGEAEGAVTQPGAPESDPDVRTDMIMSKLPRTRPQRVTGRRHREQARQARQAPRSSPEAPGLLQEEEASPTHRGGKRPTPQRRTAARPKSRAGTTPSGRPARRTATEVPVTQAAKPRDPGRRRAETGSAPGLPRLAVDGAVEAVKLPLRVGGRLTLRALDAAARSLRGR